MTLSRKSARAVLAALMLVLVACQPTPAVAPTAPAKAESKPTEAAKPAGLAAAAAGPAASPGASPAAKPAGSPSPAASPAASAPVRQIRVGLVTDVGKIDDRSFNQSTWEGVQRAQRELGSSVRFIETTDPKDYATNIGQFAQENYDVVVTVGFAIGQATQEAASR
jgi:basic membrane protein A